MAHYGGTLTSLGRLSRKPIEGTQFKTEVLLERLVRFDLMKTQGQSVMSDDDISKVLNKSVRRIVVIRRSVAYLRKRMEIMTGISTDAATSVEISVSRHKQMLSMMIPDVMRVIAEVVRAPITPTTPLAERKFKFEVVKDILDREGSHPRISRTDAHVKHEHDFSAIDMASKELLDALGDDVPQEAAPTKNILDAIAINKEFTNSANLTSTDMEFSLRELETNGTIN